MAKQFKDQGGAASMDPSPFYRWVTSRVVRRICSPQRLHKQRRKLEKARLKAGHEVQGHKVVGCVIHRNYYHGVLKVNRSGSLKVLSPISFTDRRWS